MSNTLKMVQTLFPKTKNPNEVASIIDSYRVAFKVDTDLRLAMFLAQVREEIGEEFRPVSENLNYTIEALPKLFASFKGNDFAKKYGRSPTQKAQQEMIANIAYANRIGNGSIESGDGWRFRGRGSLQITGRTNYTEVQKRIDRYAPNSGVNIINGEVDTLEASILIGLGFWIWKDIYLRADSGNIDKVTEIINKYTSSYENRKGYFNKIKHLVQSK